MGLLLTIGATLLGIALPADWGETAVVLLYLPPVLVTARYAGLTPAIAVSLLATLTFNYFFTVPKGALGISRPADFLTISALFLVAVVTSQLTSAMRSQTQLAAASAARNATIAGLARRLVSCTDREAVAKVVAEDLARLFDCRVAVAFPGSEPAILAVVPSGTTLSADEKAALAAALDAGGAAGLPQGSGLGESDGAAGWSCFPVVGQGMVHAAIGLGRGDGRPPVPEAQRELLGNLLDQTALALERARLEAEAATSIAARERDRMRAVLLASIGTDVKPRLLAIAAGARSLRRNPGDAKAARAVASEAGQLQRYVDALADLGPGEDLEPLVFGPVTIDLFRHRAYRHGAVVHITPKEFALLAELARHAGRVLTHRHLLRAVWGPAHEEHIDYLRVAIRSLRRKLEEDPKVPRLIVNEPALGYRLTPPDPR